MRDEGSWMVLCFSAPSAHFAWQCIQNPHLQLHQAVLSKAVHCCTEKAGGNCSHTVLFAAESQQACFAWHLEAALA